MTLQQAERRLASSESSDRVQRKLLMVANCFPPRNISGSKRPFRLAKYLPEFGYGAEVISASGRLPGWDHVHSTPDGGERRRVRAASRFLEFIQRRFLPYSDSMPWIPFAVDAASQAMKHSAAGAVFSTSPPVASHLVAMEIKRRFGCKWIADFRDPLLGNPFRNRKGAWIYDATLESLIFRFADAVIANTDAVADRWRDRHHPKHFHKIHVIWNGYDPDEPFFQEPLPQRDYRVLSHVGSIYGGRVPTSLLAALGQLIDRGALNPAHLRIRLIGPLEPPDLLERSQAFSRLAARINIECSGAAIPEADARRAMAQSDYLCLLDNNDRNAGLQVPAKLFEYIRVGRPIIALTARNSPAQRVLERSEAPHACIYPDSSDAEAAAILEDFLRLPARPYEPSRWFWENFDGRNQTRTLASLLDQLLGPADGGR